MDKAFLGLVKSNIAQYGFHITSVQSSTNPRYAYTIGLTSLIGFELTFAGGIYFLLDDLTVIISEIADQLREKITSRAKKINVTGFGRFSLRSVDNSWSEYMTLGVFDFYKSKSAKIYQIIPEKKWFTGDIPDMSVPFDSKKEPVWRWFVDKWSYPVPETSLVVTNFQSLQGKAITEVMRWEPDQWEMFTEAATAIEPSDVRIVPLALMIGIDKSLSKAIKLKIGKGIWRESIEAKWQPWG